MAKEDWFRKTTWTGDDQADFWSHLKRSRTRYNKAQYTRIQASYLSVQYPEVSLELLDMMFKEFPEDSQIASAELLRGQIFLKQDKLEDALEAFERALAQEVSYPNVQTNVWSDYGLAIARNRLVEHYDNAEKYAITRLDSAIFPAERYVGNAVLAIINHSRKFRETAAKHARLALAEIKVEHSGFSRHPDVGLVKNPDEQLIDELKAIAQF